MNDRIKRRIAQLNADLAWLNYQIMQNDDDLVKDLNDLQTKVKQLVYEFEETNTGQWLEGAA